MADPQTDQGFLPGLLGKIGGWFGSDDPAAEYGGLLSDPATKAAFRERAMGAAAQAFAQGGMPAPYKGGIPLLSTIGMAGGAASTSGDSLMKARLEAAQAGLANQQVDATKAMVPMYQAALEEARHPTGGGGGAGTGGASTGAPGAPAKGTDITPLARLGTGDTKSTDAILSGPLGDKIRAAAAKYNLDPVMLAAQVNAESSGDPTKIGPPNKDGVRPVGLMQLMPDTAKAMGVKDPLDPEQNLDGGAKYLRQGLDATNGDLPSALKFYYSGSADEKTWGPLTNAYPSRVFALAPKPVQTAAVPGAPAPAPAAVPPARSLLDPRGAPLPGGALAPGAEGADAAAPAVPGKQAQVGPYAPVPGQPPPQGVYVPPGGGPAVRIEDGQPVGSAPAPAMPPPAAAAPGRVGGLLDLQGGGETGSPLGRVAGLPPQPGGPLGDIPPQAVAQLAKLASASGGPIVPAAAAAPANAPPAAAPTAPRPLLAEPNAGMEGGPPLPTGAVNPQAVPPGLMTPQGPAPPPVAPAVAAPVGPSMPNAAPAPAIPQGPPVAPQLNLPPIPTQMPAMPSVQMPQATPGQAAAMGIAGISALIGKPAPAWIQDLASMPAKQAMAQYTAWVTAQTNMLTEQYKKQIEVSAAGTISYLQSQGQLPADLTKMTNEQNLKLRNSMAEKGLQQQPDGSWGFMPGYVEAQGIRAKQEADAKAAGDIQVKNRENQLQMERDLQQEKNKIAMLPLQKRQEALFTDYADNVQKPAANADNARKTLGALSNSLANFQTGKTSDERLGIAKLWADGVTTLGFTPSAAVQQMIASGETINKQGNTLGFEMAKELGSRESQMVIQAAIASNPGLAMSPNGNRQLIQLIDNGLQRDIAKKNFYDNYLTTRGTYEGADAAFRKANPVEVTVSSVPGLEYHAANEADLKRQNLPPGTIFIGPDGNRHTVGPNG